MILWQNPHDRRNSRIRCNAISAWGACLLALGGAGSAPADEAADRFLARGVEQVLRIDSLSVRLRFRGRIMGRELVGVGEYFQLDDEGDLLSRLTVRMGQGDDQPWMAQVRDQDQVLWTFTVVEGGESLERVDLRRLHRMTRDDDVAVLPAPHPTSVLAIGGLPQLLGSFADNFDFAAVGTKQDEQIVVLEGDWRPKALARVFPDHAEAIAAGEPLDDLLPAHLPRRVGLELGAADYFPYAVTYYGAVEDDAAPTADPPELMRLEFYDLRRPAQIGPKWFRFDAAGRDYVDRTDEYVARRRAQLAAQEPRPAGS